MSTLLWLLSLICDLEWKCFVKTTNVLLLLENCYESYSISILNIVFFAPESIIIAYGDVKNMMLYFIWKSHKETYATFSIIALVTKQPNSGEKAIEMFL